MSEDILNKIKENVVQGRVTRDDEGLDEEMVGQPGVSELVQEALDKSVDVSAIINEGLSAAMKVVGSKFENEEYYIPDMLAPPGRQRRQAQGQDNSGHRQGGHARYW